MPTHHLHISTEFMFFAAVFIVGLVSVIFAFVRSIKNDRLLADAALERAKALQAERERSISTRTVTPSAEDIAAFKALDAPGQMYDARTTRVYPPPQHYVAPAPYATAAPVYAHDPITGLATGMILGSALSHHDHSTTIIHDSSPSYVDSSPSYSSSSSSDSGFSYSSSDYGASSSYDSGSSGGFDASW